MKQDRKERKINYIIKKKEYGRWEKKVKKEDNNKLKKNAR